jgi:type IV fimbrial biogenesis protein FimT
MAHQKQTGFTLMELMITVVILAILAAIALPSFQSIIEKRRIVGAADNLFADLQYARSEAIKQNKTITFQFSSGANWCYGIDDNAAGCDCTAGAGASNCTVVAGQNSGVDVNVEKIVLAASYKNVQLSVNAIVSPFTIDPRQGIPTDDGTFTFSINGQSKTVSLNTVGRVKVD